jgi:predicted nucleic acid-binding protein
MEKIFILDTNTIIDFVNKKYGALNFDLFVSKNRCAISFITKLELLGFPEITKKEEQGILIFLQKIPVLTISETIENETIKIRRNVNLKLPDAIIAATAIVLDAEVVTADTHFLNCEYPALHVWKSE